MLKSDSFRVYLNHDKKISTYLLISINFFFFYLFPIERRLGNCFFQSLTQALQNFIFWIFKLLNNSNWFSYHIFFCDKSTMIISNRFQLIFVLKNICNLWLEPLRIYSLHENSTSLPILIPIFFSYVFYFEKDFAKTPQRYFPLSNFFFSPFLHPPILAERIQITKTRCHPPVNNHP